MKEVPVFERRPAEEVIQGADTVWLGRFARNARKTLIQKVRETPVDDMLRAIYETTTTRRTARSRVGGLRGPSQKQK